jgi:hypothetical protein
MTASPMNFSTVPPYRVTIVRAVAKYRDSSSRTTSGSRDSDSVVKDTRSPNRTEVIRRSDVTAVPGVGGAGVASEPAFGAPPAAVPHSAQNRPVTGVPQEAQTLPWGVPQDGQNLAAGSISLLHAGQGRATTGL